MIHDEQTVTPSASFRSWLGWTRIVTSRPRGPLTRMSPSPAFRSCPMEMKRRISKMLGVR
jgi:hypothetical protein